METAKRTTTEHVPQDEAVVHTRMEVMLTHNQLKALCELMMVSDPWPLEDHQHTAIEELIDNESKRHGHDDWIDFYHTG